MISSKSVALSLALCALALAIGAGPATTQKTRTSSYQQPQQQQPQYGSSQGSSYGGYNQSPASSQSRQSAAPRGKPTQAYVNRPARPQQAQQQSYSQQPEQQPEGSAASSSYDQAEADAEPASYGSVNGQPNQDFPAYTQVPKTSFSCEGVPYEYGMYADEETGCQAYHLCYNGRKDSFLCGVGTVFNQRILHCDYWYSVDCAKSSQYYGSNAYMGSSIPEPAPVEAGERPPAQGNQGSQSSYSGTRQQAPSAGRAAGYGPSRGAQPSAAGSYNQGRAVQPQQQQRDQQVQQQESY